MFRRARVALVAVAVLVLATGAPVASAAEPPSEGIAIVSQSGSVGAFGMIRIVGEVVNNGRLPVRFVKFTADLYDAGQTRIGSALPSYAALDVIDPGDTSPFKLLAINSTATSYRLGVSWSSSPGPSNDYFTLTTTSATTDATGSVHLLGTVTNMNTTAASHVNVDGTLYDAGGKVVDTDQTKTDLALQPGETQPFEVILTGKASYATYRLIGHSADAPALPVTLGVSPTNPTYGTRMHLTGAAAPGAAVTIQRWVAPSGWSTVAGTTANAMGAFSVDAKIMTTWFVRALTEAGPSVPLIQAQKALVSMTSNVSTVRKGGAVTFSGLVRPVYPGQKVAIQQVVGWTWTTIGYATLSSASTYTFRWVSKTTGTFSFRASMPAQDNSTANVSPTRRIVVK